MLKETMFATQRHSPSYKKKIGSFFVTAMLMARLQTLRNPNGSRDKHCRRLQSRAERTRIDAASRAACEDLLGSSDGRDIFRSLAATLAAVA